nr:unnamed protein product [Haemonchus contortus]
MESFSIIFSDVIQDNLAIECEEDKYLKGDHNDALRPDDSKDDGTIASVEGHISAVSVGEENILDHKTQKFQM